MVKVGKSLEAKPFLKWAGGKTQLLNQFEALYPQELREGKIKRYIEPFVGSGAVFFNIAQKYGIEEVYISDINYDLITTYIVIKDFLYELTDELFKIQSEFIACDDSNRESFYYNMRNQFNLLNVNKDNLKKEAMIKKSSLFIFLNKTCFNGLFRVNAKGQFNVPFGRYKNPKILDRENLVLVSSVLKNVQINSCDYKSCYDVADSNTFIYFDPPYRPIKQTSSFTAYAGEFNDNHQIELANFYKQLHNDKNALLMLSNSDPKNYNTNDNFFDALYSDYNITRLSAKRMINSIASGRGTITEILITNFNKRGV